MARFLEFFWLCFSLSIISAFAENYLIASIDCGTSGSYEDSLGITWQGDESFIQTGETATVAISGSLPRQFNTLRFFQSHKKNCYVIPGTSPLRKYLVRASFYYGNYDGKSSPPSFSLQFDGNEWASVVTLMDKEAVYEATYNVTRTNISICVGQTHSSEIPFISSLEVRLMNDEMYPLDDEDVLFTIVRTAFGSPAVVRYPDDPFDRIWHPNTYISGLVSVASDSNAVDVNSWNYPPEKVMLHAVTPSSATATSMIIPSPVQSATTVFVYRALYYSEVSFAAANSRYFDFEIDGRVFMPNITPPYKSCFMHYNSNNSLNSSSVFSWVNRPSATVPPLINAWEFFIIRHGLAGGTNLADVAGLKVLQDVYQQLQSWSGDPCLPIDFAWDWLNCSHDDSPRVTDLYLSGYGLKGALPVFSALTALQTIDLSNNSLSGEIPYFLCTLPQLRELNLAFNCLNSSLPLLCNKIQLNVTGMNTQCDTAHNSSDTTPNSSKKKLVMIVGASAGSFVLFVMLLCGTLCCILRRRRSSPSVSEVVSVELPRVYTKEVVSTEQQPVYSEEIVRAEQPVYIKRDRREFTYAEIVKITNNFERPIGKGRSGYVYHGCLQNQSSTEVAVKLLTDCSSRGTKELLAEVRLLMTVHHRNLVPFIGFFEDGTQMGVINEYMQNGNLRDLLMGDTAISEMLTWKKRLEIALDVATGLEYLHSGCRRSIIHRDVNSRNILLNEKLEAKLADFGLSKVEINVDETSRATIGVSGSPGYVDPEFFLTCRLTKKSDVYSFGVVLFELICGLTAIFSTPQKRLHIVEWAIPKLRRGESIDSIIDPRIKGQLNMDSVCKIVELAIACTVETSTDRPNMDVVSEQLREANEM